MAENTSPALGEAVNLLALDGGGIRGVSELLILDEIMHRVQHDLNLPELPRPCDYFDLIGGTSTGGLIALMLGRLQMTTDEALRIYNSLARDVFSKENKKWFGQDGTFRASTLEARVQELVSTKRLGERMLDPSNQSTKGKTFVCAVSANNMAHPRRFRTYPARALAGPHCTIWEAARATTAAPTFFKRIAIGMEGQAKEEFIDGGLGCNNPANQVLEEAKNIFGGNRLVRCLVSIGTGHPGTIGLAKPDAFQKVLPTKLIDTLRRITTDCERTANGLSERFKNIQKFYFRFNVAHGTDGISLEEWEKIGQLTEHTNAYMADVSVSGAIDEVVDILCNPRDTRVTLGIICSPIPTQNSSQPVQPRRKPTPSAIFTGRENVIDALEHFFLRRPYGSTPKREYLLHGLGGAGKTQIALKFAQKFQERFERIIWIDASSRLTVEHSYKGIAVENNLGDPGKADHTEAVLRWLSNSKQEWLLLFDGCESTEVLNGLVPGGDHGNILYTSRDPAVGLSLPRNAVSEIKEMESEDALTLLLRATQLDGGQEEEKLRQSAKPIVEILGFLPLAIDIAGASIRMGRYHLDDYVDTFRKHRKEMMEDSTFKGASRYNQAVYTAWDISYDILENFARRTEDSTRCQDAKSALEIVSLFAHFHNEFIMEEIFERAAGNHRLSNNPKAQLSFGYCAKLSELLKLGADGVWDPFIFRKGISLLLSLSLITQDQSGRYFSMHVLVHSWARDHMPSSARPDQLRVATALLSASISWTFLTEDYTFRRRLLPHIRACKTHSTKEEAEPKGLDEKSNFSLVLYEAGYWLEAEELGVQVVETRKRVLGAEHPDTLTSMGNLASTYRNQGRWKEAEELEVQVVETRKRVLGAEHPDTLTSMDNLASTYRNQGRWKEAEELGVQVVETRKRVLGAEHPDTLASMGNLASTFWNQGRWKEAEELEVQVVETRKRVLGAEHPSTLTSINNLAFTWKEQGRVAGAIEECL